MSKQTAIYLRVSTLDQENGLKSQRRALKDYCINNGFSKPIWYQDRLSGKDTNRPAFKKLQRDIFNGKINTVVVWKLDRLSRSLKDGINILTDWLDKNIRVISITQQLDFSGATGQLVAGVLLAVAQMERENLRENTKRGLAAAKARGIKLGKRPKLFAKDITPLLKDGMTIQAAADKLNKSKVALYNCLKREGIDLTKLRSKLKKGKTE